MRPAFFSVTYGAGGSTRERTFEAIQAIQAHSGVDAAPHLTCVASTREGIREILDIYRAQGIHRIVALRGDLPSGMREFGEFRYANELVEFIRTETGNSLSHRSGRLSRIPPTGPESRTRSAQLQAQGRSRCQQRHHAVFLQPGFVFPPRGRLPTLGSGLAHRARHHADHQLHPTGAVLGRLRSGNSALDSQATGRLRRRSRGHPRLWLDVVASCAATPAGRRCARTPFLHDESSRSDVDHRRATRLDPPSRDASAETITPFPFQGKGRRHEEVKASGFIARPTAPWHPVRAAAHNRRTPVSDCRWRGSGGPERTPTAGQPRKCLRSQPPRYAIG
jgi:hypothetical protein